MEGHIEQIGPPQDIYRRPQTAFVADFIGTTNFVEGTIKGIDATTVAVDVFGKTLNAPKPEISIRLGQMVKLVLRPEAIQVVEHNAHYQGTVRWAAYMGNQIEYQIDVFDQRLIVVDTDPRHTLIYAQDLSNY